MFGLSPATLEYVKTAGAALAIVETGALIWVAMWLRAEIKGRLNDQKFWSAEFAKVAVDSTKGDHETANAMNGTKVALGAVESSIDNMQTTMGLLVAGMSRGNQ